MPCSPWSPGKAKPLASPKPLSLLVPMTFLPATISSNTRLSADLQQNSSLLRSFEVALFEASQIRQQKQWAVLYPCLSPELPESGWGLASQGTGAVPGSEHQALEGAVLGTAPAWQLVSAYFYTFPAELHCREGWASD